MASFKIEGGHLLSGTITPQGAKNEALQVICATLLTNEAVTISNIPNIRDVNNLIQLLKDIGVKVTAPSNESQKATYTFIDSTLVESMQAGILVNGGTLDNLTYRVRRAITQDWGWGTSNNCAATTRCVVNDHS